MAKNYGTRRSSRQKGSAPQQFLVITVVFLLGCFTASFIDMAKITHWVNDQVLADQGGKPVATQEKPQAQLPPKPKFEFYTLLTNEKGKAQTSHPASTTASPATNPVSTVVTAAQHVVKTEPLINNQAHTVKVTEGKPLMPMPAKKGSYQVQVAAFKAQKDAEHLKGMLILKGYNVTVVPVNRAGSYWFRVVVGPYSNRDLAQKAQIVLAKTERLHGMVTGA